MNVDRIGLMEKITVLHTGIVRAVRVLTIITVKAGMATTVRGAMVIVVHLMATMRWWYGNNRPSYGNNREGGCNSGRSSYGNNRPS